MEAMAKRFEIRNSTAEFLIFVLDGKEDGIQVMYKDETIWATQKAMAQLFDCSSDNIGLHLKNIFASGELVKDSVTEKNSATASDGKTYQNALSQSLYLSVLLGSIPSGRRNSANGQHMCFVSLPYEAM